MGVLSYKDFFYELIVESHPLYKSVPNGDEGVDWFITGKKPVVMVPYLSKEYPRLKQYAEKHDLANSEIFDLAKIKNFAVAQKGKESDLELLQKTFDDGRNQYAHTRSVDEKYHRTLGKIFGYSQEDIDAFVKR